MIVAARWVVTVIVSGVVGKAEIVTAGKVLAVAVAVAVAVAAVRVQTVAVAT